MNKNDPRLNLSRREFLRLASLAAGGAVLVACAPQGAGQSAAPTAAADAAAPVASSGEPAVVRFWSWYTDQEDQFPKIVADFEALNPNIKVDLQIKADVEGAYLPALLAAAAADDLPEIYAPHVYSVEFGRKGLAADLLKELGADFMSDFFPSANSMFLARWRPVRRRLDGADDGLLL